MLDPFWIRMTLTFTPNRSNIPTRERSSCVKSMELHQAFLQSSSIHLFTDFYCVNSVNQFRKKTRLFKNF